MLSALSASVDRLIADAILARAQRRWLPLRLVPAAWIRPLVKPTATLIRREISRAAATTAAIVGVLVAFLLLISGW
ncbi:MAG TPA: hypothetical protein VGL51_09670 [Solirubrobacteraceae bacterium]|jgi:hypothetical protein